MQEQFQLSDEQLTTAMEAVNCFSGEAAASVLEVKDNLIRRGINSYNKWACFLGQLAHESDGFYTVEENLNYSAQGLGNTWPTRFPTPSSRRQCNRNPEKIANRVYGGRMGNGMGNGDGWKYRGRGFIQLTGKCNYQRAGGYLGLPFEEEPELLSTDYECMWLAACWFFTKLTVKGKAIVDHAEELNHKVVTKRINGGKHGLLDRIRLTHLVLDCFNGVSDHAKLPLVKKGARGEHVREVQSMLGYLGYPVGKPDGVYGPATGKAIFKFQAQYNLVVDGVLGSNTFDKLCDLYCNSVMSHT